MNFSFGNTGNQPTSQGSGFSFGNPAGGGFSFGAKPTSQTTTSGFSFGGQQPSMTPVVNSAGGFGSSVPVSQSASTFSSQPSGGGNFAFGNNPAPSSTQPTTQPPAFGFGSNLNTSQAVKPTFGFGMTSAATSNPTTGFGFGTGTSTLASTNASSGFSFGTATMTSSVGGFGFGTGSATNNPTSGASFPSSVPPANSSGLGSTNASNGPAGFGFGKTNTSGFNTPSTGLNFGGTTSTSGFGINSSQTTSSGFNINPGQSVASSSLKPFGVTAATTSGQSSAPSGFNFSSVVGASQATTQPAAGAFSLTQSTNASGTLFQMPKPASSNPPTTAAANTSLTGLLTGQKPATTGFSLPSSSNFSTPGNTSFLNTGGSTVNTTNTSQGFQVGALNPSQTTGFKVPTSNVATSSGITNSGFKLPTTTTASAGLGGTGFKFGNNVASSLGTTSGLKAPLGGSALTTSTAGIIPSAGATSGQQAAASTSGFTSAPSLTSVGTISTQTPLTTGTSVSTQTGGLKLTNTVSLTGLASASTSASSKPSAFASGLKLPTATSTSAPTPQTSVPSLKYKDLETKINKWTGELEQQEHLFLTQATQVNAWNKLLIENSEKITQLNSEFEKVSCDQERLNQELDFIKTQQEELESLLAPLEKATRQQVTSLASSVHTHHADVERERTYNLAENIDGQLKQMVQDLGEVIDHVNTTSTPSDASNPVNQISKILSAHMDSLQWLDSNSGALQQKLEQLTKQVNERKMEQESRFRLAFD